MQICNDVEQWRDFLSTFKSPKGAAEKELVSYLTDELFPEIESKIEVLVVGIFCCFLELLIDEFSLLTRAHSDNRPARLPWLLCLSNDLLA